MQTLNPATLRISAVLALLFLSACQGCQTREGGLPLLAADAESVEFGKVAVGERKTLPIVLRNVGRAAIRLETVAISGDAAFAAEPAEGLVLDPGSARALEVAFEPTEVRSYASTLTVVPQGDVAPLSIALAGEGVRGLCAMSATALSFGTLVRGEVGRAGLTLQNTSTAPLAVTVGALTGDAEFAFDAEAIQGLHVVAPTTELRIPIQFHPARRGQFRASFGVASAGECGGEVTLEGIAVDDGLVVTPSTVDFGYVQRSATREVELRNPTSRDVVLTSLQATPAVFGALAALPVTVKAGAAEKVKLTFNPKARAAYAGSVRFDAELTAGSAFVSVKGIGGGPDVFVSPRTVDLGDVNVAAYRVATISISNRGTDWPGTDDDNLGTLDPSGHVSAPRVSLELVSGTPSEFVIDSTTLPLRALPAGSDADLRVRLRPTSPGLKRAVLHIFTNDDDEPEVTVPIQGNGTNMPLCDYEVRPVTSTLHFGRIPVGSQLDRELVLVNRSTQTGEDCRFWITAPLHGPFELPKGSVDGAVVKAGDYLSLPVRFRPTVNGIASAQLEIFSSSRANPRTALALTGEASDTCVHLSPSVLDAGMAPANCNGARRTITVMNECDANVALIGLSLEATGSTGFRKTQSPALPKTIAPHEWVSVEVAYRPVDAVPDASAFLVQTYPEATYVVPLRARQGAAATDDFTPRSPGQVDVLFVVDAATISGDLTPLANGYARLMANAAGLDFHLGVTTAQVCDGYPSCAAGQANVANGRLEPLNGLAPRFLQPTSPNAANEFASRVLVGTNGQGLAARPLEAARLALTTQRTSSANAGFLREGALLSVVFVANRPDASPASVPLYAGALREVKPLRPNDVTLSALMSVDSSSSCSDPAVWQSPRLPSVVTGQGGRLEEICPVDWNPTLDRLSGSALGYRTRFELSSVPDAGGAGLTVELNGAPATGWTYVPAENALRFTTASAVAPTDTLVVRYPVACLP